MTSLWPISQARNSGVCFITSRESTMAPRSSSSFTVLTWPDSEVAWSAAGEPRGSQCLTYSSEGLNPRCLSPVPPYLSAMLMSM